MSAVLALLLFAYPIPGPIPPMPGTPKDSLEYITWQRDALRYDFRETARELREEIDWLAVQRNYLLGVAVASGAITAFSVARKREPTP